jgi:hypothetical protein
MQSVSATILELAWLAKVASEQIVHYVTGLAGAGAIVIEVPRGRCIVINEIVQTDLDTSLPHSIQIASAGTNQGADTDSELMGTPSAVMYLFPSGKNVFTLTLTPLAGKVAHTIFSYYEMPDAAADALKNSATRLLVQP